MADRQVSEDEAQMEIGATVVDRDGEVFTVMEHMEIPGVTGGGYFSTLRRLT